MNGIRLNTLFSYMPNKLKYCGPESANSLFYDYLKNKKNEEKVKNLLVRFEALYPYLKIIAEENNKDIFDYDVVESYWLGNQLSELDKQVAIKLIKMLNKRGLVDSIADKLTKRLEKFDGEKIPLTHLFHVMFVGVGAVTGKVPTILANMDKCRISWGMVKKLNEHSLIVDFNQLICDDEIYFIDNNFRDLEINYDKYLFNNLNVGDAVAIHWGLAVKKLESRELNNLRSYTDKVIKLIARL